ncbi:MAG: AMP-binding protein, partial [Acidimicrobiia bacterium]
MDSFEIAWVPDEERAHATNTSRFMRQHGIADYDELVRRSTSDPEWFWPAVIDFIGLPFDKPWFAVRDTSRGHPWATWFIGATFNLSKACVDRWAAEEPTRVAVRSKKESGETTELTYGELENQVSRLAGALRSLGVVRGDAVAVYLPMSSVAVISLLAIARLGAVLIPLFSGYGVDALAVRLENPKPKVMICANGFVRRGKLVRMKEIADHSIDVVGEIDHTIVVDYTPLSETPMTVGRDLWWHDVLPEAELVETVFTHSEDPVMIAYTSGTTGPPKGAVHVQAGLTVKIAAEGAFQ